MVWRGKQPGVYDTWKECKVNIEGETGALYKGFPTEEMAERAYRENPWKYIGKKQANPQLTECHNPLVGKPFPDSICVDAACSGNPGVLEYRGVDTQSGAELFRKGPFPEGTVNIGEFLAIVHALAWLKQRDSDWPVYSDSATALAWMRNKKVNTKLIRSPKNEGLFEILDRALKWVRENTWPNKILKWETACWGEIPADFGRK